MLDTIVGMAIVFRYQRRCVNSWNIVESIGRPHRWTGVHGDASHLRSRGHLHEDQPASMANSRCDESGWFNWLRH